MTNLLFQVKIMFPGSVLYWASWIYAMKIELRLMENAEISEKSGAIWCFINFEATLYIQLWLTAPSCLRNFQTKTTVLSQLLVGN